MFVKCLNPRYIVNPYTKEKMMVPCGKCEACLSKRQSNWVTRINSEAKEWPYVVFFTLTYDDLHLPKYDVELLAGEDSTLSTYIDRSLSFCETRNWLIPCVSVRDCQLFIKRLRKRLYETEPCVEKRVLRYYLCSEYGPTTFRPHYHGILFFSSARFSASIKEHIYKAWSSYSPFTRQFTSFGKIDVQFVCGDAANYVAQYVSFISNLPAILQTKPFRPFSLFSKCPPIGFSQIKSAAIQKVFHNGLTSIGYRKPDTDEVVELPLFGSLKDYLFPKCKQFSQLTTYERIALYGVAAIFPEDTPVDVMVRKFKFDRIWKKPSVLMHLLVRIYGNLDAFPARNPFDIDSFTRLVRMSRRVLVNCSIFNCSLEYYVSRIELFYKNADYYGLCSQLQAEEEYLTHVPKFDKRLLPYLIDPLFGNNDRSLDLSVYDSYRRQFGLSQFENHDYTESDEFKTLFSRCKDYYENSKKNRCKNEYLQQHPNLINLSKRF